MGMNIKPFCAIWASIILLQSFCPTLADSAKTGDYNESIKIDNLKRTYLLHIPKGYDQSKPLPLVFNLHGGFGNASFTSKSTGMSELADKEGFFVVYPEAEASARHWNDGRGLSKANDVKYVSTLIDNMESRFNIDKSRVFACGVSNGGIMSYRLAVELSGKLAAVASVAGSMAVGLPTPRPQNLIPFLEIHATADTLVPWAGGKAGVGGSVWSVDESLRRFRVWNNTSSIPSVEHLPHKDSKDKSSVDRITYKGQTDENIVQLLKINGGMHGWPRGDKSVAGQTKDIDATTEVWNFFKLHPRTITTDKYFLNIKGTAREYYVHKPTDNPKLPVIILLHGGGGTSSDALLESNMMAKSDQAGFILVTPEATRPDMNKPGSFTTNPQTWNDGSGRFSPNADDVVFISTLIDKVVADFKADPKRVFVTGFSNGASMTNRVGAELSDKVLAIAPVSGHLWLDYTSIKKPVSVCYIIGTDDPLNPINGGNVKVPSGKIEYHPPVQKTIDKWTKLLGCVGKPETVSDSNGVKCVRISSCTNDTIIDYWTIQGLGHVWPGAVVSLLPVSMVGKPSNKLIANDVIWNFFQSCKPKIQ